MLYFAFAFIPTGNVWLPSSSCFPPWKMAIKREWSVYQEHLPTVKMQWGCISGLGNWEIPHISDISRKMKRTMCCPTSAESMGWEWDRSQLDEYCLLSTWKLDQTGAFWISFSICGEMENNTGVYNTFEKEKCYTWVVQPLVIVSLSWHILFQSCTETICTLHQPEVFGDITQALCKTRILAREEKDSPERRSHYRLLTRWSPTRTSSRILNISKDTESMTALNELSGWNDDTGIMLLLICFLISQQRLCFCVHYTRCPVWRSDWAIARWIL